jgi:hypothetical protein
MWKSILVVVALLTPFAPVVQAQDDLNKVNIKISKLAGNVYLLVGDGGNIAASIGEDGIVLWMTSTRRWQRRFSLLSRESAISRSAL